MKFKILSVIAVAAGLSLAAGQASASPRASGQVTGARLQSALLPSSAFGNDFHTIFTKNTGAKLRSPYDAAKVSGASCGAFESFNLSPSYGKTAQAQEGFINPSPGAAYPFAIVEGVQYVSQFASAQAAAAFYRQSLAKYRACWSFTIPNPVSITVPGGGSLDISTMFVHATTVGKYPAFRVSQLAADSEASGYTFNFNMLFAVAGPDLYEFYEVSGVDDAPSPALMARLISRVQRLH